MQEPAALTQGTQCRRRRRQCSRKQLSCFPELMMTSFPPPFQNQNCAKQTDSTSRQRGACTTPNTHNLSLQQTQHLLNPPTCSLTNTSHCGREALTTRRNSNSSEHRHIAFTSGTIPRAGAANPRDINQRPSGLLSSSSTTITTSARNPSATQAKQSIHPTTTPTLLT